MVNGLRLVSAVGLTASLVVTSESSLTAQQYLPNRPPMSISLQGAENPLWSSTTFFCDAVYEWQSDRYGAMGALMDSATVRIGTRSDRRDRSLDATLTASVFSGSPRYGTRFTTPPCGGRETTEFDVIAKLYGYSLARVGPATVVRRSGGGVSSAAVVPADGSMLTNVALLGTLALVSGETAARESAPIQISRARTSRLLYRDRCGWQGSGRVTYVHNASRSRSVVTIRESHSAGPDRWSRTQSYTLEPGGEQWVGCTRGDTAVEFKAFAIVGERIR